ncbi:MAG: hypothetical protein ABFD97_10075 [Syntrophobacter sp.]
MKRFTAFLMIFAVLVSVTPCLGNYVFCSSRIQTVESGLPECASQTFTGGHIVFKIGSTTVLDEDLVQTNGVWPSVTLSSGDDFNAVLATLTNGTSDNVEVTVTANLSGGGTRTLGGAVPESAFFFQNHQIEQGHPAHTDFSGVITPTAVVFRVVGGTGVSGGKNFVVQYTCEIQ